MQEAEEMEEARLTRMLQEEQFNAYYNSRVTGEHYLLSSGRHSDELYQVPTACRIPAVREKITGFVLKKIRTREYFKDIGILVGVATGGLPFLFELQRDPLFMFTEAIWVDQVKDPERIRELKKRREVRFQRKIPASRPEFVLGRNFKIDPDKRIVIIDDVYTTGNTIRAVIDACNDVVTEDNLDGSDDKGFEANVAGIIVMVNRASGAMPIKVLMPALTMVWAVRIPLVSYDADECPSCQKGILLRRI